MLTSFSDLSNVRCRRHTSPTRSFNSCGGMPFLLKLFRTVSCSIAFRKPCGSSASLSSSSEKSVWKLDDGLSNTIYQLDCSLLRNQLYHIIYNRHEHALYLPAKIARLQFWVSFRFNGKRCHCYQCYNILDRLGIL